MGYRVIKGTFALHYRGQRHVGSRPDGDSAWFMPDDRQALAGLGGRNPDYNGGGFVQLRLEGIDALELHYPGSAHQHKEASVGARNFLLRRVGFTEIEYAPNDDIPASVRSCTPVNIPGHIMSRTVDPFGRPVAFVFAYGAPESDGSEVFLTVNRMDRSVNAQLMKQGHVYPAYYDARDGIGGLPWDLRDRLTQHAINAWPTKGIWRVDASRTNPRIRNKADLMELAIWPKLYRRLAKYFNAGNTGLSGFEAWLRADTDRDDEVWIIPRSESGNLHDIFEINGDRINMLFWPEEIIVIPR